MANATVSIYFDKSYKKKDGTSRFYIQVILNRKTKRIPLNLFVKPEYYNPKTKRIKEIKELSDAKRNNLYLKEKENEIEQIIIDLERKKHPVTFSNILNVYLERFHPNVTIYEIDEDWLDNYRNLLIEKLGNKQNTVYNSFSMIRKYITLAHKKSILKVNPFINFSFEKENIQKNYLTLE